MSAPKTLMNSLVIGEIYIFNYYSRGEEDPQTPRFSPFTRDKFLQEYHQQLFKVVRKTIDSPTTYQLHQLTGLKKGTEEVFCSTWLEPLPFGVTIWLDGYRTNGFSGPCFAIEDNLISLADYKKITPNLPHTDTYHDNTNYFRYVFFIDHFKFVANFFGLLTKPPITAGPVPCDCPMKIVMSVGCTNKGHF